jgi:hypothetical protein
MVRSGGAGPGNGEGERGGGAGGRARTNGPIAFIVRVSVDTEGGVTGVVERVRTGQKERVHGLDEIGRVIASMIVERRAGP